jgi:hypothetical protein
MKTMPTPGNTTTWRLRSIVSGRRSLVLIAVLAIMSISAAAALGASKSPFKPGLYVGKTSQGQPVKLKVRGCGKNQCLEGPDDLAIEIELPCPSIQETSHEVVALSGDAIAESGAVHVEEQGFAEGKTIASFKVGRNGVLTGRVHSTQTLEDGARCDSGNVTLSAKIGGATK